MRYEYVKTRYGLYRFTKAEYNRQVENVVNGKCFRLHRGVLVAEATHDLEDIYETYSPRGGNIPTLAN